MSDTGRAACSQGCAPFFSPRVAIVATGPTVQPAHIAKAYAAGYAVWLVNDAYRLEGAPSFASLLYACDHAWWYHHCSAVRSALGTTVPLVTQNCGWNVRQAASRGLIVFESVEAPGLSCVPGLLHRGNSSSYQALNLAALYGCKDIVLLGHTLSASKGKHFFGPHPPHLDRDSPFSSMIRSYERAKIDLDRMGVRVRNATPDSALSCFDYVDPEAL